MAAGLGFKTFTTGEVLTAADTNGYLMQGVLVFASSAARAAAITSPQEGQYSYLKDTNSTEYYDGAAWIAAPIGDITGVTAGTGISGGGTSGTVTITNDMATTITASGDIVVGTGSGTYDNLPIGTTGQVLTADTTVSPYKVKWAAAAGGGKVLQVVQASTTTATTIASTTAVDTTITGTITPSSSSSKVLVLVNMVVNGSSTNGTLQVGSRLVRTSTTILDYYTGSTPATMRSTGTGWANGDLTMPVSMMYLDSPATTSATTYKVQGINPTVGGSVSSIYQPYSTPSYILLLEIGA
jgi:hypothetical protein